MELLPDCARCAGLCCVGLAFARSADFPFDKPAGQPCPNLRQDFRCAVHAGLREGGYLGCVAFDCHGAGPQVTQVTFGGRDWRDPALAGAMFRAFAVLRPLHELRVHVDEALALPGHGLEAELRAAAVELEARAALAPEALLVMDLRAVGRPVHELLLRVSERVRAAGPRGKGLGRKRELVGADLRGADLRGVDLAGRLLLGADLRDADLRGADLRGADLRGADLRGADLREVLFLLAGQLEGAKGDAGTRLPPGREAPPGWSAGLRPTGVAG